LQSAHDQTLSLINRGHTALEIFDAVKRAKARGLKVATHLIFGLPGETEEQMMETVRQVAACGVEAIKIHQLCVFKGTPMETDFRAGRLPLIEQAHYVRLVADALEMLPPEMIIMRLVAEGTKEELIAPEWSFNKSLVMDEIDAELKRREQLRNPCFASSAQ